MITTVKQYIAENNKRTKKGLKSINESFDEVQDDLEYTEDEFDNNEPQENGFTLENLTDMLNTEIERLNSEIEDEDEEPTQLLSAEQIQAVYNIVSPMILSDEIIDEGFLGDVVSKFQKKLDKNAHKEELNFLENEPIAKDFEKLYTEYKTTKDKIILKKANLILYKYAEDKKLSDPAGFSNGVKRILDDKMNANVNDKSI